MVFGQALEILGQEEGALFWGRKLYIGKGWHLPIHSRVLECVCVAKLFLIKK